MEIFKKDISKLISASAVLYLIFIGISFLFFNLDISPLKKQSFVTFFGFVLLSLFLIFYFRNFSLSGNYFSEGLKVGETLFVVWLVLDLVIAQFILKINFTDIVAHFMPFLLVLFFPVVVGFILDSPKKIAKNK